MPALESAGAGMQLELFPEKAATLTHTGDVTTAEQSAAEASSSVRSVTTATKTEPANERCGM